MRPYAGVCFNVHLELRYSTAGTGYPQVVSKSNVRLFLLRFAMPAAMVLALYPTLRIAEADSNTWLERKAVSRAARVTTDGSDEYFPFVLPFRQNPVVCDLVAFQWPAFLAAGLVVPVPALEYGQASPKRLTLANYAFISMTVAIYWIAVGTWMSKRLFVPWADPVPKWFRIVIKLLVIPVALLFVLFLAKDIVHGGWPEGPNGAYGLTAWLALALVVLSSESGWMGPTKRKK